MIERLTPAERAHNRGEHDITPSADCGYSSCWIPTAKVYIAQLEAVVEAAKEYTDCLHEESPEAHRAGDRFRATLEPLRAEADTRKGENTE